MRTFRNKENTENVLDKSLQHKLNGWYGTLRLSPLDGKLNRNFVPLGGGSQIEASETIHNRSKLIMKKPKEFMLFKQKPKLTSILNSIIKSRAEMLITENNISEMDELYVKGTSKFNSEVEYGLKVPERERMYVKTKEAIEEETLRRLNKIKDEDV